MSHDPPTHKISLGEIRVGHAETCVHLGKNDSGMYLQSKIEWSRGTCWRRYRRLKHRMENAKLTKLTESKDIEAYLTTCKRMMAAHKVDKEKWAFKLAPNLSGKAQPAYTAMNSDDVKDCEQVKETILLCYNINVETYRQRFSTTKKQEDWSYRDLIVRIQDLLRKWTKDKTIAEEVVDLIVTEQFLNTLPQELRV